MSYTEFRENLLNSLIADITSQMDRQTGGRGLLAKPFSSLRDKDQIMEGTVYLLNGYTCINRRNRAKNFKAMLAFATCYL